METISAISEDSKNEHIKEFSRPEMLEGYTLEAKTNCGTLFLTLNEFQDKLTEVRMTMGKSGSCFNILLQTIALLISVMLQEGVDKQKIYKTLNHQFEGHCGNQFFYKGDKYYSCLDFAIQRIFEDMANRKEINIEKEETI
jgi:ribonucleoside-diphosphate reductase alpha chain